MFFFSSPPVVELVDAKDGQVVFTSNRQLKVGKDTSVRVSLKAEAGSARIVPLKVFVHQARPVAKGQVAYVAALREELPFEPMSKQVDSDALRRGERLDCHLRILSPDLPGYSAISVDMSATGMQIETRSAVDVGEIVRLRLETEISELEIIEVQARVAWCRPEGKKRFRAGLEFRNLNIEVRFQLDELNRYLKRREEANLTQRVLECADRYLLGYLTPQKDEAEEAAVLA